MRVGDYLVAVNATELKNLQGEDVGRIVAAIPPPRTLKFVRLSPVAVDRRRALPHVLVYNITVDTATIGLKLAGTARGLVVQGYTEGGRAFTVPAVPACHCEDSQIRLLFVCACIHPVCARPAFDRVKLKTISVGDYLVGVNGVVLSGKNDEESLKAIKDATVPRTLKFVRFPRRPAAPRPQTTAAGLPPRAGTAATGPGTARPYTNSRRLTTAVGSGGLTTRRPYTAESELGSTVEGASLLLATANMRDSDSISVSSEEEDDDDDEAVSDADFTNSDDDGSERSDHRQAIEVAGEKVFAVMFCALCCSHTAFVVVTCGDVVGVQARFDEVGFRRRPLSTATVWCRVE